jgi:hypothetical protein
VDHKDPVIDPVVGFTDWNEYIRRMFCGPENLQVLCDPCHAEKTRAERLAKTIREDWALLRKLPLDPGVRKKALAALRTRTKRWVYPKAYLDELARLSAATALKRSPAK